NSGLRLNIFQALPGTTTFVALWENQVIATLCTITDNPLGLPMDKIYDLSEIRKQFRRISEASGLAIDKEFRGHHGKILFPIIKFLFAFCERYTQSDCMVIAVNPKQNAFYEDILFFQNLNAPLVGNYDFVKGAPAVGKYLDLTNFRFLYKSKYNDSQDKERNLYHFLFQLEKEQLKFPEKRQGLTYLPVMHPTLLANIFEEKERLISSLPQDVLLKLRSLYNLPEYEELFKKFLTKELRQHQRFEVELLARNHNGYFQIQTISEGGLSFYNPQHIKAEKLNGIWWVQDLQGKVEPFQVILQQQWQHQKSVGFSFTDVDSELFDLISSLKSCFVPKKKKAS
ncbi:MAG: hypothetical protein KDD61_17485, partial [Bdellovibrionales bacterium]|nr:hypothetical protein [Bdellovibrionales bacterium]